MKEKKNKKKDSFVDKPFSIHRWQQRAINDSIESKYDKFIFAQDIPQKTGKLWIASTAEAFYENHRKTEEKERNFNAMIDENKKCHPYLDFEFSKELNPNLEISEMVIDFLEIFIDCWSNSFKEMRKPNLSDFLIFDSSSDKKASIHVHGPFYCCFENIYHLKAFLTIVNKEIEKKSEEKFQKMIISKTNSKKEFFIDLQVYNHKQVFRMYKSTKTGQNRHLYLSPKCSFRYESQTEQEKEKEIFFKSIPNLLFCKEENSLEINDQELLLSVVPKNAFQREEEKRDSAIEFRKLFTSPNQKTHIVNVEKGKQLFKCVSNKLKIVELHKLIEDNYNKERIFNLCEIFDENVTKLVINLHIDSLEANNNFLECLQSIILNFFQVDHSLCSFFVLKHFETKHFIAIWPHLFVDFKDSKNLVEKLKNLLPLQQQNLISSLSYSKGFIHMIGSESLETKSEPKEKVFIKKEKKKPLRVNFFAHFDNKGNQVELKLTFLELLDIFRVRAVEEKWEATNKK